MARVLGVPHSVNRSRQASGYKHFISTIRNWRLLSVVVACAFLLACTNLLRLQLSDSIYGSNDYISQDIDAFLVELDEQVRAAGADVSQMQLRMLRLAAGVEPERPERATRVFSELLSSISSLGNTLPCSSEEATGPQFPTLPGQWTAANASGCSQGCFFAANLYNSKDVLPNMIIQLLAVLGSLGGGEHAQRSFVSVYESGSTDSTPALLSILRRTLDVLGVPNRIVTHGAVVHDPHHSSTSTASSAGRRSGPKFSSTSPADQPTIGSDDRIRYPAKLRNAVLEPLEVTASGSSSPLEFDRLIFISDVFFCASDVRRLLRYDSADMACGLDLVPAKLWLLSQAEREAAMAGHLSTAWGLSTAWAERLSRSWLPYRIWKQLYGKTRAFWPWSPLVFYDMWVSRDVSGGRIRTRTPYSLEPWTADRLAQGMPFPAYCCWNGLVNMRAEPLLRGRRQQRRRRTQQRTHAQLEEGGQQRRLQEEGAGDQRGQAAATAAAADGISSMELAARSGFTGATRTLAEAEAGAGAALGSWEAGAMMGLEAPSRPPRLLEAGRGAHGSGDDAEAPLRFRDHGPGECAASERSLMCGDLHAAGYHRVLIDPNVRVVYDWSAVLALYDNFDQIAPVNVPGLRYQPMEPGDARQVEVSWDDDWVPRLRVGAAAVECCDIRPGRETMNSTLCEPRDMTGRWRD